MAADCNKVIITLTINGVILIREMQTYWTRSGICPPWSCRKIIKCVLRPHVNKSKLLVVTGSDVNIIKDYKKDRVTYLKGIEGEITRTWRKMNTPSRDIRKLILNFKSSIVEYKEIHFKEKQ